jgi:sugar O-acyltransferase (sialic acid O-acetyltransferase NeuD family)
VSEIVIIGVGGMGREALAWLQDAGRGSDVLGFIDDASHAHGATIAGLPVVGPIDLLPDGLESGRGTPGAVVAIGSPAVRLRVLDELAQRSVPLVTILHPTAIVGPRTSIADGAIICPRAFLSCDVSVGRGAIVNYGAMIGHDGVIGEAVFIAPGAHLAGNVTVGRCADVGIGASVIQGVAIGEHAVVGAGAVVIRDVEPGATVVGVPARPIRSGSE